MFSPIQSLLINPDNVSPVADSSNSSSASSYFRDPAVLDRVPASMLYLAKAFDTGTNLGSRERDLSEASMWYSRAVSAGVEKSYLLLARQAEIALTQSEDCYDPNRAGELYTEAADAAMEEMVGKLATR